MTKNWYKNTTLHDYKYCVFNLVTVSAMDIVGLLINSSNIVLILSGIKVLAKSRIYAPRAQITPSTFVFDFFSLLFICLF